MNSFVYQRYKDVTERLSVSCIAADEETIQLLHVCRNSLLQVQLLEPSNVVRDGMMHVISLLQESIDMIAAYNAPCSNNSSSSRVSSMHQNMMLKRRKVQGACAPGGRHPEDTAGPGQDDRCDAVQAMRCRPKVDGLDSVVGLQDAKAVLRLALVLPCLHPQLFTGGRSPWSSVLLYGPPGTGKTRLAHAIAAEVGAELYCVSSAELLSRWVGESEKMVRKLFEFAMKKEEVTVVFLDEIDGLCRKRQSNEEELSRRVKSQLLTALDCDGLRANRTFVMGATNRPWDMDSAFLRRFQKKLFVPLPDSAARQAILRAECQDTKVQVDEEQWQQLGADSEGLSAAEMASLCKEALFLPVLELSQACYWRRNHRGIMEPCSRNAEDAMAQSLVNLSPDQVAVRDVTFADFQQALRNTKSSVTAAEMHMYQQFTDEFGQLK